MFTLTENDKSIVTDLRQYNNDETAFEVIESWLENTPEEIEDQTSEFLHHHLYDMALTPELFKRATRLLAKIYDHQPDDEREDLKKYKALFAINDARNPTSVKKDILSQLMSDKARENAHDLAFHLLEDIFPSADKDFNAHVVKLLSEIIPIEPQRVHDLMLVSLDELITHSGWSESLQNLVQTLVISLCQQMDPDEESYPRDEGEIAIYAEKAANAVANDDVLVQAFNFCKEEVLVDQGISHIYATTFLTQIYKRFPDALTRAFKDEPELLVDCSILLDRKFTKGAHGLTLFHEWSAIGKYLLMQYAQNEDFIKCLTAEIKLLDADHIIILCNTLIRYKDIYPLAVVQWAQTLSAEKQQTKHKRKIKNNGKDIEKETALKGNEGQLNNNHKKRKVVLQQWPQYFQDQMYTATYNDIPFHFKEVVVPGDGNCAFYASGFERIELNQTLLLHKTDAEFRKKFTVEIKELYFSNYVTYVDNPLFTQMCAQDKAYEIIHRKMLLDREMDALHCIVLGANPELKEQKNNLNDHFDAFPDSDEKAQWLLKIQKYKADEQELDDFFSTELVFTHYITYSASQPQWCSNVALVEYARIKNINLCIWKKGNRDNNQLILEASHGDIAASDTIHLHFKFAHFDRLFRYEPSNNNATTHAVADEKGNAVTPVGELRK